jgi:transposase-like protein
LYNKNNQQEEERSEVVMGIKRRQYSKEQKEEIVQKILSSKSILELGKENNISPGLINRWRRQ